MYIEPIYCTLLIVCFVLCYSMHFKWCVVLKGFLGRVKIELQVIWSGIWMNFRLCGRLLNFVLEFFLIYFSPRYSTQNLLLKLQIEWVTFTANISCNNSVCIIQWVCHSRWYNAHFLPINIWHQKIFSPHVDTRKTKTHLSNIQISYKSHK